MAIVQAWIRPPQGKGGRGPVPPAGPSARRGELLRTALGFAVLLLLFVLLALLVQLVPARVAHAAPVAGRTEDEGSPPAAAHERAARTAITPTAIAPIAPRIVRATPMMLRMPTRRQNERLWRRASITFS